MPEKAVLTPQTVGNIFEIPRSLIRPFVGQPREEFDPKELEELADSIVEVGQITPIWVREVVDDPVYRYELIEGERRYIACGMRSIPTMKAEVRTVRSKEDQFLQSVVANFGRSGHTPLETAHALNRVRRYLFGEETRYGDQALQKLARIFAHSTAWVHQHLSLLNLHPDVQKLMGASTPPEKRLKFQVAIALANRHPDVQVRMVREIAQRDLNTKRALGLIRDAGAETRVNKRGGRRPADDFDILRRFLVGIGESAEGLLEMSRDRFENMFKNRRPEELRAVVETLEERLEQLEALKDTVLRLEKQRGGKGQANVSNR